MSCFSRVSPMKNLFFTEEEAVLFLFIAAVYPWKNCLNRVIIRQPPFAVNMVTRSSTQKIFDWALTMLATICILRFIQPLILRCFATIKKISCSEEKSKGKNGVFPVALQM